MATAVSISIRREAAIKKLTVAASGIGDSFSDLFSDLPPLDLTELGKDPEIKQVVILERIAEFLGLVEQGLIAKLDELTEVLESEPEPEPATVLPPPTAPVPNKRKR